jgi:hypothetical protein
METPNGSWVSSSWPGTAAGDLGVRFPVEAMGVYGRALLQLDPAVERHACPGVKRRSRLPSSPSPNLADYTRRDHDATVVLARHLNERSGVTVCPLHGD